MDLANSSVFFDFDGTITLIDTGEYLLERLASPEWRRYDELFNREIIGSRECLIAQFTMLPRDEILLRKIALEVPVDPGFGDVVEFLREGGAEVTVLSDGFGLFVAERCPGVKVLTNEPDIASGTISFPNFRADCDCAQCGTCKRKPIEEARARDRLTIMIGDGTSDRHAARSADLVFAKGSLASWCSNNGIVFTEFQTIRDVLGILRGAG